jgi:porphobilinogen deaminase
LSGKERVYLELRGSVDVAAALESIAPVEAVHLLSRENGLTRLHVEAAKGSDVRQEIFAQAVAQGWTLLEMRRDNTSLEDVFREFTAS